jgi:hypothetical protein
VDECKPLDLGKYLPEVTEDHLAAEVVHVDLTLPMARRCR